MEDHARNQDDPRRGDLDLTAQYSAIRFTGLEALEFLQRQLSNDVMELSPEIAQVNAFLTPKGRVIALLTLVLHEGGVLALVDRQMADRLGQALQRYVIRADVQIVAPDLHWRIGGRWASDDQRPGLKLNALTVTRDEGSLAIEWPGARKIMLSETSADPANGTDQAQISMQRWQQLDIEHLLARVGPAETEQFVPQMLALDTLKVVNFKKGCYPGQEVVARTHYRGRIKRRLVQYNSNQAMEPGTTLSIQEYDALKPVGKTLQGVATAKGDWLGLAVIHESGIAAQHLVSATEPSIAACISSTGSFDEI